MQASSPSKPISHIYDVACNQASSEAVRRRGHCEPFFYANCSIGLLSTDQLNFREFAKGQLIAMAVFTPPAIALFAFTAF